MDERVHMLEGATRSKVRLDMRVVLDGETECGVPAAGITALHAYTEGRLYETCRSCFEAGAPWEPKPKAAA